MGFPDPKKPTYNLKELTKKWKCPMSDLFYFAEADKLQICKQQNRSDISLFASDDEKEAASKFSKDIIPIDDQEATKIYTKHGSSSAYNDSYPGSGEPISLVITHEEKERFEKEECNSLESYNREDYQNPQPIEKNTETPIHGLKNIAEFLGLTQNYLKNNWLKKGIPIHKGMQKTYAYPSELNLWLAKQEKK